MNRRNQGVQNFLILRHEIWHNQNLVFFFWNISASIYSLDADSTFNWNVVDSNVASFRALNCDVYMDNVHGTHRSLIQYLSGNGQIAVTLFHCENATPTLATPLLGFPSMPALPSHWLLLFSGVTPPDFKHARYLGVVGNTLMGHIPLQCWFASAEPPLICLVVVGDLINPSGTPGKSGPINLNNTISFGNCNDKKPENPSEILWNRVADVKL